MKKRRRFLLWVLLIGQSIMTGCSGVTMKKEYKADTEEVPTVVRFQTWNPADHGLDSPIHRVIAEFEQIYPNIRIEYEYIDSRSYADSIKVELMACEGADIYAVQAGMFYRAFRDYEERLTPYCEESWGMDWKSHFETIAMDTLVTKDEIYGLPLGITYAGTAWADTRMLEEYGLSIPRTYEELLTVCGTLKRNGEMPLALGAEDEWINVDTWMSIAADVNAEKLYGALEGKCDFTEPELIEAFQIWQNCFAEGIFQDGALAMTLYNDVNDKFQRKGNIPMMLNGSWALNMFTVADEQTRENFDGQGAKHEVFAIDWNNDGEYHSLTASVDVILCMNEASEVKEEAFLFMKYLVDEGQKVLVNEYLEYLPSVAQMELEPVGINANGQACLDEILSYQGYVAGTRGIPYGDLQNVIEEMLELLARGEIAAAEAAERIQKVSEALIR